jgi:hypothetical protein
MSQLDHLQALTKVLSTVKVHYLMASASTRHYRLLPIRRMQTDKDSVRCEGD